MGLKAEKLAKYILNRQDFEEHDITNLKLQKLLYYAQGSFLAYTGRSLFDEEIEAWDHGPVVKEIYHQYKTHQSNPIPFKKIDKSEPIEGLSISENDFVNEAIDFFSQYSAWRLREMTHAEKPWIEAYNKGKSSTIDRTTMCDFFKTQLKK